MEKENIVWENIEKIEKINFKEEVKEEIIQKLGQLILHDLDTEVIRKQYKELLARTRKYSRNYYAHICIIINVLKSKKDILKQKTINIKDIKYIKQRIAGELTIQIGNNLKIVGHTTKKVEYDYLNYEEGIGKENTQQILEEILKESKNILDEKILNLERAKIWVKKYREYIIKTYGRWSKEYEEYMNTAFEMQIVLTSPNLLLLAMRETMKKGIKNAIKTVK